MPALPADFKPAKAGVEATAKSCGALKVMLPEAVATVIWLAVPKSRALGTCDGRFS